ncbi:hypothetical protein CBP31_06045 [Oceanisphaera profunda]|uniref:DUF3106 domain-containing protein n=1 Tax=Oceanisphaera profunda TaxID=1416627 RepID=A0A1Y0D403_9GAMM|nr:hypothetical protein [Oceanisphaera profunda]ART82239.1 hypothetical protein CBP31_06045 [Oceanisphaera profunda]
MNKAWYGAALALMLSGCTLPFPLLQQSDPKVEVTEPSEAQQLQAWLALSDTVQHSNDSQRQQALSQLQNTDQAELKRALWQSHPKASYNQRQQAQQLFQQHLATASPAEQQLLGVYQSYNQEILQMQRQLVDRQQHINNLTKKLKELANIEQQINDRKFQE